MAQMEIYSNNQGSVDVTEHVDKIFLSLNAFMTGKPYVDYLSGLIPSVIKRVL